MKPAVHKKYCKQCNFLPFTFPGLAFNIAGHYKSTVATKKKNINGNKLSTACIRIMLPYPDKNQSRVPIK